MFRMTPSRILPIVPASAAAPESFTVATPCPPSMRAESGTTEPMTSEIPARMGVEERRAAVQSAQPHGAGLQAEHLDNIAVQP